MRKTLIKALAIGVALVAMGSGIWLLTSRHSTSPRPPVVPELANDAIRDLGAQNQAGKIDQLSGDGGLFRNSVPEDTAAPGKAPASVTELPPSTNAALGMPVYLGTFFKVKPQGYLQIQTEGNWIMGLEEQGEFVLDDAERDSAGKLHSASVWVRRGVFKAKSHDFDPTRHVLEIRNPAARIVLENGEFGMRVSESGHGQIWLVSGKATVHWNDGKEKQLQPKQMDTL